MKIPKEIYLKQIGKRGKIKIWRVDGKMIREKIDEGFTNFGQHFRYPYIPEYEFWLDRQASDDERRFFISHLLVEWKLMKEGMIYPKAVDIANAVEKAERVKSSSYLKSMEKKGTPPLGEIRKEMIGRANKLNIWLVDGKLVRNHFRIEFVAGGHDLVYDFVPSNEVWIEDDVLKSERPYIILHELYEREKMSKGMTYNRAHRFSSKIEWKSRQENNILLENLKTLGYEDR